MTITPSRDNTKLIDRSDIEAYYDIMFSGLPEGHLTVRGIGEKGTRQEGRFREQHFAMSSDADIPDWVVGHAKRWGNHQIATFCVPAVLSRPNGDAASVAAMGCMILDMDTDCDTQEAWDWLKATVGEPTMVVRSGGINGAGSPKRHFYWRLSDGHTEIQRIVELRHVLALRSGGDVQFGVGDHGAALGRAHQPIRIPGTVHSKGGVVSAVILEQYDDAVTYSLSDMEIAIRAMPAAPWLSARDLDRVDRHANGSSMRSLFDTSSGKELGAGQALLNTKIHSGTADGVSRYDAFNAVSGHYLRIARLGELTVDDAYAALRGWVLVNMVPPWPDERIRSEWRKLLSKDQRERGPIVKQTVAPSLFSPQSSPDAVRGIADQEFEIEEVEVEVIEGDAQVVETHVAHRESPLLQWAGHRWVQDPAPELPFLVAGLICKGEQHMLAAEGGAGKSYAMIDLAMRVAAKGSDPTLELEWLGQPILEGGTVVLILNEDSMVTVNGRMVKLNKNGLLQRAGDRFIPLPMSTLGGAFTLSDDDGNMTARWAEMYAALKLIPDLALVIMDTFSTMLHGPEVDSVIVNEMMRQANRLTGETGAAMLWLHHVRKPSEDPVRNVEDMKNAVRGSTAILGAMRLCFGMWRAGDWERRCKAMGMKADRDAIWRCAVVKTNLDVPLISEKTLVRREGRLLDLSDSDPYNRGNHDIRAAWLVLAVREAAKAGFPMSKGGKNAADGLYARRSGLPEEIGRLGHRELASAVELALEKKLIVACSAKGGASPKWLDVPTGTFATQVGGADMEKGAWTPPDWSEWVFDGGQGICVKGRNGAQHVLTSLMGKAQ
jgi:hypothetical protein